MQNRTNEPSLCRCISQNLIPSTAIYLFFDFSSVLGAAMNIITFARIMAHCAVGESASAHKPSRWKIPEDFLLELLLLTLHFAPLASTITCWNIYYVPHADVMLLRPASGFFYYKHSISFCQQHDWFNSSSSSSKPADSVPERNWEPIPQLPPLFCLMSSLQFLECTRISTSP